MITSAFRKLKCNLELNQSFNELIQQKHNAVRSVIERINPSIKTKLIGSLQRKTRIKPAEERDFDIDILVILGSVNRWAPFGQGISTQDAMRQAKTYIQESERYSAMNPKIDNPAIIFEHKDGVKVELVPAYIDNIGYYSNGTPTVKGRGYWVPKSYGWELADYDYDAEFLSALNKISDGMLIPTIKMLKALKRQYFPEMCSFHLEIISMHTIPDVVLFLKNRNQPVSYDVLVKSFFSLGKILLDKYIKTHESNSPTICLSGDDLLKTQKSFNVICNYCDAIEKQADDRRKVEMWRKLFGHLISQEITL